MVGILSNGRQFFCVLASIALLAACGGGGGSGGDGTSAPSLPLAPSATGLVPDPPQLGAVILDDATKLRPLRHGARWVYQGQEGGTWTYSSSIDVSGSGSTFVEVRRGLFNGDDDTVTTTVASGVVTVRERFEFGDAGASEEIAYVELRSPVRAGDQITLIERNDFAFGIDVDGDRVNDIGSIAAFSRVIGWEDIQLPVLGRSVRAVRVDTTLAARVIKSSDGTTLPTVSTLQSVWYLPGVGIVRLRTSDTTMAVGPDDTDERLVGWDGVTEGLGAFSPTDGKVGETWLGRPLAAAGLGDRALVINARDSADDAGSGATISQLSSRGEVLSVTDIPGFATRLPVQLVRTGSGAGLIWMEKDQSDKSGNPIRVRMLRFNAQGLPTGQMPGILLADAVDSTEVAAAYDGARVWMLWTQYDPTTGPNGSIKLVVRAFDDMGVPVSPLIPVGESPSGGQVALGLASRDGSVLVSWAQKTWFGDPTRFDIQAATVDLTGLRSAARLGSTDFVSNWTANESRLAPLLPSGSAGVIVWGSPLFTSSLTGDAVAPRGVALLPGLQPRWSNAAEPDGERLPVPALTLDPVALSTSVGDRVVVAQTSYGVFRDPQLPDDFLQFSFATPGAVPLAQTQFTTLRWTARSYLSQHYFGTLERVVALNDRVLLLGNQPWGMMVSVAWPQ
jgi:hypothetical protein